MTYRMAQIPMTSSELEGHFVVTTDKAHRAVPLHLQSLLLVYASQDTDKCDGRKENSECCMLCRVVQRAIQETL